VARPRRYGRANRPSSPGGPSKRTGLRPGCEHTLRAVRSVARFARARSRARRPRIPGRSGWCRGGLGGAAQRAACRPVRRGIHDYG
jgi:hypothetical protein